MQAKIRYAGIGPELETRVRLAAKTLVAYQIDTQVDSWEGSGCHLAVVGLDDGHGLHVAEIAVRRGVKTIAVAGAGAMAVPVSVLLSGDPSVAKLSAAMLELLAPASRPVSALVSEQTATVSARTLSAVRPAARQPAPAADSSAFAWSRLTTDLAGVDVEAVHGSRTIYLSRSIGRVRANTLSDMMFAVEHLHDGDWRLRRMPAALAKGQAEISRSLDGFLLQAGLGNAAAVRDYADTAFSLNHWPDLAGTESVDSLRVAGALAAKPMSANAVARKLDLPTAIVNAHFWAFDAGGLLKDGRADQGEAAELPAHHQSPGLIAKLAAHFGIKWNYSRASS